MKEEMITGYQYSPSTGFFTGEYKFPNNKDKDDIYLPPYTTLKAPPKRKLKEGNVWKWNEEDNKWKAEEII